MLPPCSLPLDKGMYIVLLCDFLQAADPYSYHQGLEIVRANDSLPHWEYVAGLYKASWSVSPQLSSLS